MSEYSLRLAKPHCDACHQPKNGDKIPYTQVTEEQNQSFVGFERAKPSFPSNREFKQGELLPAELTLAERIQRTIHKTQTVEEEEL